MIVRSPVPLADLLALYAADKTFKRLHFTALTLQWARSESCGYYADLPQDGRERPFGPLLAAYLLYPRDDDPLFDHREALFYAGPGATRILPAFVHHTRLTLAGFPQDVRLTGHARTPAGARLFALLGFVPIGGDQFEWTHGGIRNPDRRVAGGGGRRRGGEPGAQA